MEKIVSAAPQAQALMFTATMGNTVLRLAEKILRDPQRIELAVRTSTSHELIEQRLHVADSLGHKKELLRHLVSDKSLTRAIASRPPNAMPMNWPAS